MCTSLHVPNLQVLGLSRAAAIYTCISRYAIYRDMRYIAIFFIYRDMRYIAIFFIYRDMRYIAIFFWSYRDTNVHGYTEIAGRIDGERRKYTKSHSADATSVLGHMHVHILRSNSAAVLRTYIL